MFLCFPLQGGYMAQQDSPKPTQPAAVPNETYYLNRDAQQSPNRRSLGIALIVVGMIWLVTMWTPTISPFSFGALGSETILDHTTTGEQFVLDAGSADVQLVHGSGSDIRIEAIRDGGDSDDYQVNIEEDGNLVRVSHTAAPCFFFCNRSLSYRITLPSEIATTVQTLSGDVIAEGLANPIVLRTTSGDIDLTGMSGAFQANSTSGDITLEDGNLASAKIETTSGDVQLSGASNTIQIKTVSGNIELQDVRNGQLDLTTISGDIDFNGSIAGSTVSHLDTVSGAVQLYLPYDSNIAVDASSVSGAVATDFTMSGVQEERTLRGAIGDGTTPLTIKTTSGDVDVLQQ
jgi:predicted membrane protein